MGEWGCHEGAVSVLHTHARGASEAVEGWSGTAAEAALKQVTLACDGLCASNDLRAGAESPLYCASMLLKTRKTNGMHALFAEAAGLCAPSGSAAGASGADAPGADAPGADALSSTPAAVATAAMEFQEMVNMWNVLKLEKVLLHGPAKAPAGYRAPQFAVAIAGQRSAPATRARLESQLARLLVPGVTINGRVLVGMGKKLPNHMRGVLLSHLHVLARLRGESLDFNEPDQLKQYLEVTCNGLLSRLFDEWYDDKGNLRPTYAPAGRAVPEKVGKAAKADAEGKGVKAPKASKGW